MTSFPTLLDHYTHYDGRRIELWKADRYFLVRIVPVRGKPVQHPYTSERRAREAFDAAVRGC
jgi:hypothetical protein